MSSTDLVKVIKDAAEELRPQLEGWRRDLHRRPELGLDTEHTQRYVRNELEKMGYEPQKCGAAGLVALAGKDEGKVYLLRADMDALPLTEDSGEEFSSEIPGRMHACGHDMHTAMLLGAAKILKDHEDLLEGRIKLMFESGEETSNGAADMIAGGVLEDPKVDAAQMIHVAVGVPIKKGRVLIPQGGTGTSASCTFSITVTGKGGHAAMPKACKDPITALCHIHSGLEEITARETGAGEYLVIAIGQIHAGNAHNIIPDTAVMEGTIRTLDTKMMDMAKDRIREVAEGIAGVYRTSARVEYKKYIPAMIVDKDTANSSEGYLKELLGDNAVRIPAGMQGGGSEDFAYVTEKVPSVTLILAAGDSEEGYVHPAHHPQVRFDESVLPTGTAVHAYTALRWLQEHK